MKGHGTWGNTGFVVWAAVKVHHIGGTYYLLSIPIMDCCWLLVVVVAKRRSEASM